MHNMHNMQNMHYVHKYIMYLYSDYLIRGPMVFQNLFTALNKRVFSGGVKWRVFIEPQRISKRNVSMAKSACTYELIYFSQKHPNFKNFIYCECVGGVVAVRRYYLGIYPQWDRSTFPNVWQRPFTGSRGSRGAGLPGEERRRKESRCTPGVNAGLKPPGKYDLLGASFK